MTRTLPSLARTSVTLVLVTALAGLDLSAQSARTTRRGRVYQGEEGAAAVGRRGAAVKTKTERPRSGGAGPRWPPRTAPPPWVAGAPRSRPKKACRPCAGRIQPRFRRPRRPSGRRRRGRGRRRTPRRGRGRRRRRGGSRRYGGVAVYEDYEAWRGVAAVGVGIAIGTMLAKPPAAATTVVVGSTTYWHSGGTYYVRTYSGGRVAYQVVGPPAGVVIATLPASCTTVKVGAVAYQKCGPTYYQRVSTGYRVVVLH